MKSLKNFLDSSVTPYHTVSELKKTFASFCSDSLEKIENGQSYFTERSGTSLIAFKMPKVISEKTRFRLVVTHSDFPGLRLTPHADCLSAAGHVLHPEIYGSPILSTWLDRDLTIAGCLIGDSMQPTLFKDDAFCRISNLAIHLTRGNAASDLNKAIDKQNHLNALCDFEESLSEHLERFLKPNEKLLSFDARLVEATTCFISENQTFVSSGRLDNLLSCYAAKEAFKNAEPETHIAVFCALDHEEVGSKSREGADGNFLQKTLAFIFEHSALSKFFDSVEKLYESSFLISADAAHALHPNFEKAFDLSHAPILGKGIAVKLNAQKRYATDIYSEAYLKKLAFDGNLSLQNFVCRNDMPCGSTVGPILSAHLGIPTVDVGIPMLSMHSIRELAHLSDVKALTQMIQILFEDSSAYCF